MKKYLAPLLACLFTIHGYSQNLIPNGSFEDLTSCPTGFWQIEYATPWFGTIYPINPPSLFNQCATSTSQVGVPDNSGGNQFPIAGAGYAGVACHGDGGSGNYANQYMTVPLTGSLDPGVCYYASMLLSLGEYSSQYGIDKVGMYFSATVPVADNGTYSISDPTPQVYAQQVITDVDLWTQVSGIFTAQGGGAIFNDW